MAITERFTFSPGDRVNVEFEGSGTVTEDGGELLKGSKRVADHGVYVRSDKDGIVVSCAHDQVTYIPVIVNS